MTPLVSGAAFLLTAPGGDITGAGLDGLFLDDTRHLSRWELTVDGAPLRVLTPGRQPYCATAVLTPPTRRSSRPAYTVFRSQALDAGGLAEELRLVNHLARSVSLTVAYAVAADFADQFELRTARTYDKPGGSHSVGVDGDALTLTYRRGGWRRCTVITADPPAAIQADRLQWTVELPPGGAAVLRLAAGPAPARPRAPAALVESAVTDAASFVDVRLPDVDVPGLAACARQGLADLAALRVPAPGRPDLRVPGAGVPWFLTLFGRDSVLSSMFALPYRPELAQATLRALAATQGRSVDPARAEEPGKIVHEVRTGELSEFGQVPYARYYGTVDATPLFLVLLAASGDPGLARELEPAGRAAVGWMLRHGGLDEGGYLVYRTDGPGLEHHCWKDSPGSIAFRSGEPARGPIAVCEAQAYAYRALVDTAGVARDAWGDPELADVLTRRAARLRAEFAADFLLPDGFVALALDGRRRQVDALASNAGHALWAGLLDDEWAREVGQRLASEDFFSGWGIRTIAAGQPAYHPVSYHNGAVWPHDTAIAVAGLVRCGLPDAARRIAAGLVAAAGHSGHRLPELLTGYGAADAPGPVPYPHSCSPQAWAAAAPLLLISALSGAPHAVAGQFAA
jgi:glycogen debranching enzyme